MDEPKKKTPTWAYRLNKKSGKPESRLFDDVADIPEKQGWKDEPPAPPAEPAEGDVEE